MTTYKKSLDGGGTAIGTVNALFEYAASVLGSGWTFTSGTDDGGSKLTFTDPTTKLEYGWIFVSTGSSGVKLISEGVSTAVSAGTNMYADQNIFNGIVWKASGGSVGIGYENSDGRCVTWYSLAKFQGIYNFGSLYAVGSRGSTGVNKLLVHGDMNIGPCNHCDNDARSLGTGVYLHPLYDPASGLTSSDIFGPQSMDSWIYGVDGAVVTQGGDKYMSILGGETQSSDAGRNTLFVKM